MSPFRNSPNLFRQSKKSISGRTGTMDRGGLVGARIGARLALALWNEE